MNQKTKKIREMRRETAKLFFSRCAVCYRKFGKGFNFHHVEYNPSEKKYSDFKSWEDYQVYVMPIIATNPERFELLCKGHHNQIEYLKKMKKPRLLRLFLITIASRHDQTEETRQ